ncbi:unnamed protein product [Prorocentrum cordatum]|uniref:Uncharacterized protein n=1 Tax=Prorocentrum cordatum TaxID=2364126 RepID=A0ABN9X7R1_9DINO|nr:unnamed protein product [Polarella glacialis]
MSYLTSDVAGILPRCPLPSADQELADTTSGLDVISEVPATCWAQIASAGSAAAAGDPCFLTPSDGRRKQKRFSADIVNSRPTTMAIIGIVVQDQSAGWKAVAGEPCLQVPTSIDAEDKQKKLAAETASARLDKIAIIGAFRGPRQILPITLLYAHLAESFPWAPVSSHRGPASPPCPPDGGGEKQKTSTAGIAGAPPAIAVHLAESSPGVPGSPRQAAAAASRPSDGEDGADDGVGAGGRRRPPNRWLWPSGQRC